MPDFLTPFPPGSEQQPFSGSSVSLSSDCSSNGFDHASRESSGSGTAYLTDVTPPIAPSRIHRGKKAALFNAVDAVLARLAKAEPTRNIQRTLKIMENRTNPAFRRLNLLDEPFAPSMSTRKAAVNKSEEDFEDWSEDFELNELEEQLAMPLPEEAENIATADVSFCQIRAENEIEENMIDEGIERRVFSDKHKCHSSDATFVDDFSAWREGLITMPDLSVENVESGSEYPVQADFDNSVEQEFYSFSYLQDSLGVSIPEIPDESASDDSSLIFDLSASIPQLLLPLPDLNATPIPSFPEVNSSSHNNPPTFLNSPVISSLMFAYRNTQPPHDVSIESQALDLPVLMGLDSAETLALSQQDGDLTSVEDHPMTGLGFEIATSQLPESSFPSYNSLALLESLHLWDPSYMPITSTPAPLWESIDSSGSFVTASSSFDDLESFNPMMELFVTRSRKNLSIITEESSRALSLANAGSSRDVYGLGFSTVVESTFRTSASITNMRSSSRRHIPGALSISSMDMMNGQCDNTYDDDDIFYSAFEFPGDFERRQLDLTMDIADSCSVSFFTGIEPSGVFLDAPNVEPRRFSPGVVNWLLQCSEVGPLSPLNAEIISNSPNMLNLNVVPEYSWYSEIEPLGVLSEEKCCSGVVDAPQTVATPDPPVEEVSNPLPTLVSLGSNGARMADGVEMGLPFSLSSRAPRPRDVTSGGRDYIPMMSAAMGCLDMVRLSDASPASGSGGSEHGRSQGFLKIPKFKFSRRRLSAIPEVASPRSSTWSDFTSRIRSPGKQNGFGPFATLPPLTGPSGDNSDTSNHLATMPPTQNRAGPPSSAKNMTLPQPPRLVPKQPRSSWLARLSGSASSPPSDHVGGGSPGMIEHLDVPRGLGIFKRKGSPEGKTPQAKKDSRLQPVIRKFQLLF